MVLVPLTAGACAQVLGLDEPTVDGGSGGSGASTVTSGGATTASSGAVVSVASSSAQSSSGSTGGGDERPCRENADCDDDNVCTFDACVELSCVHEHVDGPADDPTDCIDVTCVDGVETETIDDGEDPPDPAPPCRTAVCSGGVPMNVDAAAGTSCGTPPLECNGEGVCTGCSVDQDCGEATPCAVPQCMDDGLCDPGLVAEGTNVDDPAGNCVRLECSGRSGVPSQIADSDDDPPDATCGTGYCSGSTPTQEPDNQGTPCSVGGFSGVCVGDEAGDAACVQCTDAQDCDDRPEGRECKEGEGNVCGCNSGADCQESWRWGSSCITQAGADQCGCLANFYCNGNVHGERCLGTQRCGCSIDGDCTSAGLGTQCIGDTCGCVSAADCTASTLGDACVDGHCGCVNETDCGAGLNCVGGYCVD